MRLWLLYLALLPLAAAAFHAPAWLTSLLVVSSITLALRLVLGRKPAVSGDVTEKEHAMRPDNPNEIVDSFSKRRWDGTTVEHVVDNRVFLLGLDNLYREAMKNHERGELLSCARGVAGALRIGPAQVPAEGYYAEDAQLTDYFRLMRALQAVEKEAAAVVSSLPEFQRLKDVTSSRLYGLPRDNGKLFPPPRDALSLALKNTFPDWTVPTLTAAAYDAALETDDYSLVGLAARAKDPVVLAALRESVVLYAEMIDGASLYQPRHVYIWKVEEGIESAARRFIETFKRLLGDDLPAPGQANAERYWWAAEKNRVAGRCVALGSDGLDPPNYYHWAIPRKQTHHAEHAGNSVADFWRPEIFTTERYRHGF